MARPQDRDTTGRLHAPLRSVNRNCFCPVLIPRALVLVSPASLVKFEKRRPTVPVSLKCPTCEASLRVPDHQAGKRGKCPKCSSVVSIPAPGPVSNPETAPARAATPPLTPLQPPPKPPSSDESDTGLYDLAGSTPRKTRKMKVREGALPSLGVNASGVAEAAAPTRKTLTPHQILAAFDEEIDPVRPTLLYRLWILIVAFIMILLPVIYAALVGLVIAGLAWHALNDTWVFTSFGRGRYALQAALAVYAGPLIVGAVVVGFMLKPFFARAAKGPKQRILDPSAEPLLHAFVDGVCTTVNSPRPARIAVDCQVNASAHREGGFLGLFGGELVLTIGLPLTAGLNIKQFAGVLAHEFGHFSQGAGMRLSVLIRKINLWFARRRLRARRVGPDSRRLDPVRQHRLKLLGLFAKLAVWFTRRVLWVLMYIGHMASSFLSARWSTTPTATRPAWSVPKPSPPPHGASRNSPSPRTARYADLQSSWQQRRLPDNFPKLVVTNVLQIPQHARRYKQSMEHEDRPVRHPPRLKGPDRERRGRSARRRPLPAPGPRHRPLPDFDYLVPAP